MKFKAQKLAAKLSIKCQERCKDYGRTSPQRCKVMVLKKHLAYLLVTELLLFL